MEISRFHKINPKSLVFFLTPAHVDIKTTEVYARADEKMKRAALETAYKSPTPEKMPSWKQDHGLLDWLKSLS